jgi:hypothetical protein
MFRTKNLLFICSGIAVGNFVCWILSTCNTLSAANRITDPVIIDQKAKEQTEKFESVVYSLQDSAKALQSELTAVYILLEQSKKKNRDLQFQVSGFAAKQKETPDTIYRYTGFDSLQTYLNLPGDVVVFPSNN